ncbi:MAG: YdcF family protein [Thiobacillaceae bacterium]
MGWKGSLVLVFSVVVVGLFAWAVFVRLFAPTSNTSLNHFDAIIVLGTSVDKDGDPSPELQARVTEGVREYERGVAPRLIVSGGPEPNHFVEAKVMARTAEAEGIPESAIVQEGRSKDTIQNGCYSMQIMESHGWNSAEVISSASHLPRAGVIFNQLPLEWRTHAAPPVQREFPLVSEYEVALETLKTVRYLLWARRTERCEP